MEMIDGNHQRPEHTYLLNLSSEGPSLDAGENPMGSQSQFKVELKQEEDGRWLAEVSTLPK
jgi:hypothetical protein